MRNKGFFCILLACFLCLQSIVTPVFATQEDVTGVANSCHGHDAAAAYLGSDELVENVSAIYMYEVSTDSLMYAWNPDVQVYPSSLVKVLTCLIAVETGNIEDVVTVSQTTVDSVPSDAVEVDLLDGEQMPLSDLLYCMMVGSANDAAAVIAEHISGTQAAFVQRMNERAQELGCTNTNFTNVHGLHDDNQYTTARDMGRILSEAVKNEQFMQYFSKVWYLVPATNLSEERNLATNNYLMNNDSLKIYYDERVTGGRAGVTNDGKRSLAASAEKDGLQIISIVMGAVDALAEDGNTLVYGTFKETSILLDAAFNGYKAVQIVYEGQAFTQLPVLNGSCEVVLGSHTSVLTILPVSVSAADLSYQYVPVYPELKAPIKAGDLLSKLQIWQGSVCVAQVDLFAMHDVSVNTPTDTDDSDADGSFFEGFAVALLVIAVVAVVGYFGMKAFGRLKTASVSRRTDRYRRNRRRSR